MKLETGVQGHFSAAHRGADGVLHGHTWEVRAWRDYHGNCALGFQDMLDSALKVLDHTELPEDLTRAEPLAAWICVRTNATWVEVWRGPERLYGKATA